MCHCKSSSLSYVKIFPSFLHEYLSLFWPSAIYIYQSFSFQRKLHLMWVNLHSLFLKWVSTCVMTHHCYCSSQGNEWYQHKMIQFQPTDTGCFCWPGQLHLDYLCMYLFSLHLESTRSYSPNSFGIDGIFLKDRHISRIFKLLLWIPGYEPLNPLVSFLLYDFCIIFSPLKDLFTAWDDKSSIQVIHGSPHSGVHILRVLRHRTVLKC